MSYYTRHIFFCNNLRDDGSCCEDHGATELRSYAKRRAKEMNLHGKGQVRINLAGCLDRCAEGPVAVVYPEGIWYTYQDERDIDEILESHLRDGQVVERLQI